MIEVPKALFTHLLEKQLTKHVRPPTKRHRGKKLRQSKPVLTCVDVWQEQLSMTHNLPAMVISCLNHSPALKISIPLMAPDAFDAHKPLRRQFPQTYAHLKVTHVLSCES